MAIIHLSGMDCTLKTTLCKLLSESLNCNIVHFDKPKDMLDGKNQYFSFINDNNYIDKNIICDRFHDGEHVYAPLYRGYESTYIEEFEELLRNIPYLFVNTTSDIEIIKQRILNRGEDFVKEEHYSTVLELFKRYLKIQSMPYIIVDTSNAEVDKYIDVILKSLEKIKLLFNFKNSEDIYFGNVNCKYFYIVKNKEDIQKCKSLLKNSNEYFESWILFSNNCEYIKEQIKILNPKEVKIFG